MYLLSQRLWAKNKIVYKTLRCAHGIYFLMVRLTADLLPPHQSEVYSSLE